MTIAMKAIMAAIAIDQDDDDDSYCDEKVCTMSCTRYRSIDVGGNKGAGL